MPYVDNGEAKIWYTQQGTGFPMLTLAPGGMRSSVAAVGDGGDQPADRVRGAVPDDRDGSAQRRPVRRPAGDQRPVGAYAADQLAVMDHLGIDRFLVFGCCIGGPFILKLCELAPERVVAAVLEQPVGIIDSNRELFDNVRKQWRDQLMSKRDDLGSDQIEAFATTMWAPDFAVSVTRDQVRSFRTPMFVLPGVDEYHPADTGREIAALAPAAELLEPWKDPRHLPAATEAVGRFLTTTPRARSPRRRWLLVLLQDAPLGGRIGVVGKHALVVQLRELVQLRYPRRLIIGGQRRSWGGGCGGGARCWPGGCEGHRSTWICSTSQKCCFHVVTGKGYCVPASSSCLLNMSAN